MNVLLRSTTIAIVATSVALFAACDDHEDQKAHDHPHGSHGDHDHGAGVDHAHPHGDEPEPLSVTVFSEALLLFMEYPPLVKGHEAEFLAHFTVLETGEPVREGELRFKAVSTEGVEVLQTLDRPRRHGLYVPSVRFDHPGRYSLALELDGPQASDVVRVGELLVHADHHEVASDAEQTEVDAEVEEDEFSFLMEQQWKIRMLLAKAEQKDLTQRIRAPGEVAAPPHYSAVVSSPMSGRLVSPSSGRLPALGQPVSAGELLGLVEPPFLMSAESSERAFDIRAKAYGVARQVAEAQAQVVFAESEHERLSRLRDSDIASEREFREAVRDLALARAELAAALELQAWHARVLERFPELHAAAISEEAGSPQDGMISRIRLEAPISGQIDYVGAVMGESVDAHETVFRIVDLSRVWIVARVPELEFGGLPEDPHAVVVPHAMPESRIDVQAVGGRLIHVGRVLDLPARSIPLWYELPNADGVLRIGMFVDALLETKRSWSAVAVPESTLVSDGGQTVVFVMIDGETFQRRVVVPGVRDGGWVEIKSGLSADERVVTRGAYAVKLHRSAPTMADHGHVH